MSYETTNKRRPDQLTKGDHVWNALSFKWEPVKDAYWSEDIQRYVVCSGPLGHVMHTYQAGEFVYSKRYY